MVFIRRSGGQSEGCDIVLCEDCANRRGISARKGGLELNMDDLIGVALDAERTQGKPLSCPSCGLELATLVREGRLGCSVCADSFRDELERAIGRRGDILPAPLTTRPGSLPSTPSPSDPALAGRLRRDLELALESEDYEEAAWLRDQLSHISDAKGHGAVHDLGLEGELPFSAMGLEGPDDDVVLSSSARVFRDLASLPFPGSPHGPSAPSRSVLLGLIRSDPAWRALDMSMLVPAQKRSFSERGLLPRSYAADDEAVVLTCQSLRGYALVDEGDHLRVRALLPGLDIATALDQATAAAQSLGLEFAYSQGLGWICSRVADCGLGCSLSATLHLPALTAAGMRDRLFRALLADGLMVRGLYSSSEESSGAVYELGVESSKAPTEASMAASFTAAVQKAVAAERRARAEISQRGRLSLGDAEGRAYGLTRHFALVGAEEAASLLSVLRLAALRGSLSGADHRSMGALLLALGSGSIALASGLRDIPSAGEQEMLRARVLKAALAKAEFRNEEGT